jgi:hypothetical protein
MVVHEALKKSLNQNEYFGEKDSIISLVIHDIFGGEILKTRNKKGWHFYNRVDGLRFDFSSSSVDKTKRKEHFEDIPAAPGEIYNYFEMEEYSTFLTSFVRSFEEALGLKKYIPSYNS